MDQQTKIADLTVAEFRELMQACFDADRSAQQKRKVDFLGAGIGPGLHDYMTQQMMKRPGIPSPMDAF